MFRSVSCVICVLGLAVTPALADDPAQCILAQEALTRILERNPDIMAASAVTEQSEYAVDEAVAARRPRVSAYARSGIGDTILETGQVDNEAGLRMSYTLFDFSRSRLALEAARSRYDASEAAETLTRQQTALEVLSLMSELLYTRALETTYTDRLDTLSRQVDARERQLGLGASTKTELTQLKAELSLMEVELADTEGQMMTTLARLRRLYGQPDACFDTMSLLPWLDLREFSSLEEAEAAILKDSAIVQLEREREAAELDARRAARGWLPSVDATGYVAETYNDTFDRFDDRNRLGIQLSVPLYDGGANKAQARESSARARQVEAQLAAMIDEKTIQAQVIWHRLAAMKKSLVAVNDAIDSASSHLAAMQRTFDLGAATIDGVLEAEERLLALKIRKSALERQIRAMEIEFAVVRLIQEDLTTE